MLLKNLAPRAAATPPDVRRGSAPPPLSNNKNWGSAPGPGSAPRFPARGRTGGAAPKSFSEF